MKDSVAVTFFILIIFFILVSYVVAALYFDGLLNMLHAIKNAAVQLWDLIKLVGESVYKTFIS